MSKVTKMEEHLPDKKDYAKEFKDVLLSVEGGDNKAKTKLAWYKLSGCGGAEVDEDGAVVLLTERVKDQDTDAMWMLGLCFEYGIGCEQDLKEAELLYKRCSNASNKIGMFLAMNGKDSRGSGIMTVKSLY